MKAYEIESWALRAIKQATAHQPSEDTWVELKSVWPSDHKKAARRIAAHANAAQGQPILWLIGVDEKTGEVKGADHAEFSEWLSRIHSEFDGLAPKCDSLNVPWKGLTVVALVFESDRAPFVVKNKSFGQSGEYVALEVPGREGTKTRSATRSELLLIITEKRSLLALLGEMEWNQAVATRPGEEQEQFQDMEFRKPIADGSLSDAGTEVKNLIMEAYLDISNAQSHKRTLESTTDQYSRQLFFGQIRRTKGAASRSITNALDRLREILT